MNVLTAPKFLQRKTEPTAPPLPPAPRPDEMRQMTMDFMNEVDRQREENAYLRSENEQQRVELKAARERMRMLETELNFIRDDRDKLLQHDSIMLGGLGAIKAAIVDLEERSRAEAYAPPGSGTQEQPDPLPEDAQNELAVLVSTIKPSEPRDA